MSFRDFLAFLGVSSIALAPLALFIAAAIGWVMNLVAIAQTCCTPFDGMLLLRIVGIFISPIGAVIGYI